MKRLLFAIAFLLSGSLALGQSSTQGGGLSTKAIQALEQCFDSGDNFICGGGATISGTANRVAKFNGTGDNVIDSQMTDNGSDIFIPASGSLIMAGTTDVDIGAGVANGPDIFLDPASATAAVTLRAGAPLSSARMIFGIPAAGGSGNFFDLRGTAAAMDGTDTVSFFKLTPTNADHTGATNVLNGILISSITGDAQATETAVNISTGWDRGVASPDDVPTIFGTAGDASISWDSGGGELDITAASGIIHQTAPFQQTTFGTGAFDGWFVDDTGGTTLWEVDTTPTGSSNFWRLRGDFAIGGATGTANVTALAIDPYNPPSGISTGSWTGLSITTGSGADHTGGTIRGINIAANSPDADTQEDALTVGTGWDRAIVFNGSAAELATTSGDLNLEPTSGSSVVINSTRRLRLGSDVFANLGAETNGSLVYCSDCTVADPCASGGSGAVAKRINGAWVCN